MPGDSLKRVSSGDPFQPSAAAWNSFLDTTQAFKAQKFGQGAKGPNLAAPTSAVVRVQNDTGSDVTRGSVLGIGGPLWTPTQAPDTFADEVLLKGVLAGVEHTGKFVIATGPIKDGTIGRGVLMGAVWTQVNFQADDDGFAEAASGETHLQGGTSGSAKILYKESGTGLKWAIVLLGFEPRGYGRLKGQLVGAMTSAGGTHTIDHIEVLEGDDPRTDPTSATETVTFSNEHGWEGDDDALCRVEWNKSHNGGEGRWEAYQVTCPAEE